LDTSFRNQALQGPSFFACYLNGYYPGKITCQLMKAAPKVREKRIILKNEARDVLLNVLAHSPMPSDNLKQAAEKYSRQSGRK